MAEFRAENQSEPSSAKLMKPSSSVQAASGSQPGSGELPTVLSSFKQPSSLPPQPPSAAASQFAGEMLAHYRLDDYIGVGGMGAVFRATDIRLDRPIALKILPPEQAGDAEIVARFQQEARAAARLDHENIARVYFVGEDRGLYFIALEYVEGVNVRDLIQRLGPLPAAEVVNYALQITSALVHASARGVVHRDIKPSNIIITESGRAKLVDMGLARNFERRRDGGLTQSGVTLGTFDYISPEQARDPRSTDARSDIYSLGCTLFHMLTGRPPFPEGTVLQKLLKHQEDNPPDPRQANPRVPDNLAAVVRRMMAKDPARRYQTPEELLSELLEVAETLGLHSTSPEGLIWVTDQPRAPMTWTTWAVWLSAAAALVIVVIVIYGQPDMPRRDAGVAVTTSPNASAREPSPSSSQPRGQPVGSGESARKPPNDDQPTEGESSDPASKPADTAPAAPRTAHAQPELIRVTAEQDLHAALEQATSGSIIEIAGDFRPQARHLIDDTAGIRIEGKQLIVRAAAGESPRILIAHEDEAVGVADWTLFTLVGAHVEFEGIRFEIEKAGIHDEMRMFALESSTLLLRRSSFFQPAAPVAAAAGRAGESLAWVARLDSGIGIEGQPVTSRLIADECFFAGGDGAFELDGPAKLELRDCTLLPYRSTILLDCLGFPPSLEAELRLSHVTLFGSGQPVFDLRFAHATAHVDAVVFSHDEPRGVLTRVDDDSGLQWHGKRNLYHGLASYLLCETDDGPVPLAIELTEWRDQFGQSDEESRQTDSSPWVISLAEAAEIAARSPNDPRVADAFRLARRGGDLAWRPPGARTVLPWGPLYLPADRQRIARAVSPPPEVPATGRDRRQTAEPKIAERKAPGDPPAVTPKPTEISTPAKASQATVSDGAPMRMPDMKKVMDNAVVGEATPPASAANGNDTAPSDSNAAAASDGPLIVDPRGATAFHTLAAACARAEDGAVIEIRHSGKLRESPIDLGDRRLTIRAGQGFRPIIELSVAGLVLNVQEPYLFGMRRGSLVLRDLDLHIAADPAASADVWSVVASRNADVTLESCTVTVQTPPGLATTLVRLLAGDADDPMLGPNPENNPGRPQLRIRNSLVAGPGNLVRVQPGTRVRVEIENTAIETGESLLRAVAGLDRPAPSVSNELELRRATIKTAGLVHYEAAEPRPWLPRLEVTASDNLLMGQAAVPWIVFRSPQPADELRGLLHWRGMNNSYDAIETFWAIERAVGAADAERYDWAGWNASPARDEVKADRARIEFAATPDGTPAWQRTRKHFTVSPASSPLPASDSNPRGADLLVIPAPPLERTSG